MARFLTIDSQFNPISFEEMIKPALLYKEEYEKQQDAIDTLAANNILDQLKNSDVDAKVYNEYNNYKSMLGDAAMNLSTTGKLDMNAIRNLRRMYQQKLAPYEARLKKRNELVAEQAKNYSPTTMYSTDYSNVSLDDINEDSSYKTYKLDDISKAAYNTLASEYQVNGKFGSDDEDLSKAMSSIDIDGLDDEQVERVRKAAAIGVNAARKGYMDYLQEVDLQNIKKLQAQAQYLRAMRGGSRGSGGSGSSGGSSGSSVKPYISDGNGGFKENPNYIPKNPYLFNTDTARSIKTVSGPFGNIEIYTDKFGNYTPHLAIKIGNSFKQIPIADRFSLMNAYGLNIDNTVKTAKYSAFPDFDIDSLKREGKIPDETIEVTNDNISELNDIQRKTIMKTLPKSISDKIEKGETSLDNLITFGLKIKLDTYKKGRKAGYEATTNFENVALDED